MRTHQSSSGRGRSRFVIAALALVFALGCQSPPPGPGASEPPAVSGFDAERALAHANALLEARNADSPGSEASRAYLRGELEKLGLAFEEQLFIVQKDEAGQEGADFDTRRNLIAAIPGGSSDVLVLMAPYDTESAGPAILLELARSVTEKPLPYTAWVVFLDGEAIPSEQDASVPRQLGSKAFASSIRRLSDRFRLAVALEPSCSTDLRIARDKQSERKYRNDFWAAAAAMGRADVFPRAAPFESPRASHQALRSIGFRDVVALVDADSGDPAGPCSQRSLAAVGEVAREALDRIGTRMARIDRASGRAASEDAVLDRLPTLRTIRWSDFNEMVRVRDAEGIRQLVNGPTGIIQSAMDLAQPERLVMPYTQIASILMSLHPSPRRVFNIGLGGGVLSRFHLHHYPESTVESVEIDPVVLALAEEYFQVVDPRHTIHEADGAAALAESAGGYEVIVVDAGSDRSGLPEVFTKMEFIDTLPQKLASDGVVVANLWAEEPAAFEKLVADYKKNYSHGVLVDIPEATNSIGGFSNSPTMTCAVFFETLEQWEADDLAALEWTDRDASEPCRDL